LIRGITIGGLCLAVAGLTAPAQAGAGGICIEFLDQAEFENYCIEHGKLLKGIEDFEEAVVQFQDKIPLFDFLQCGVPNPGPGGPGFPNGINECNIILQSNIFPGPNPPAPEPHGGPTALYVVGPGFIGANSAKVGEDLFLQQIHASLDLIFTEPNHTGIGFDLSRYEGYLLAGWHISVYDTTDVEIGKFFVPPPPAPEPAKFFWGIWCDVPIGRINIWDEAGPEPDAIDNIQMWMEDEGQPPACPWDCAVPHDKMVSVVDFLALLAQWGQVGAPCDFDGGGVGVTDFLKMLAMWGPCPAPFNDKCEESWKIDAFNDGVIEEHFDMYGATPDPWQYKCLTEPPIHKDIWYCLNNLSNEPKGVSVRTNIPLFVEVNLGCECPPGQLIACGDGLVGTEQFLLHPGEQVLIRLIDWLDLPNEELKGSVFIDIKPTTTEPVNFFEDPVLFDMEILAQGLIMKGIWNFKPDFLPDGGSASIDDLLDIFTHPINAPGVWQDAAGVNLWPPEIDNVQFSANLNPQGPFEPHGPTGLWYGKPGAVPELTNNALVANWFVDSFDIISGPPAGDNHQAMALDLIGLDTDGIPDLVTFHISVYDKNDVEIGKYVIDAIQGEKPFLGIVTKDPSITIGRVDIWDINGFAEGISSIALYFQGFPPNECTSPGNCIDGFVQCGVGTPLNCFCFEVDHDPNVGLCIQDFFCADVQPCPAGGCPPGFVCVTDSCCGPEFCVPIIKCDEPGAAPTEPTGSGLTGSGQWIEPADN
jgi:hypothetical protein